MTMPRSGLESPPARSKPFAGASAPNRPTRPLTVASHIHAAFILEHT